MHGTECNPIHMRLSEHDKGSKGGSVADFGTWTTGKLTLLLHRKQNNLLPQRMTFGKQKTSTSLVEEVLNVSPCTSRQARGKILTCMPRQPAASALSSSAA